MARALMGHVGTYGDQALAYEVARLRRRVRELETEVAQLRAAAAADRVEIDLELHRMADKIAEKAEPALA